ncbi:type II toxin-antitoxin system RelE/ParE family toxin [Chitinophagaceae bacterium MMS25-I14]
MVYEIVWTRKAVESFTENMQYLEENWTKKEIEKFTSIVNEKLLILTKHPETGSPRNKKYPNIRHTILHKRVSLIYRLKPKHKRIELLLFWNTYRHPAKLKIK